MNEGPGIQDLGRLISDFVRERSEPPAPLWLGFWSELVCLYLFVVSYEVFWRLGAIKESHQSFSRELDLLISEVDNAASIWINKYISDALAGVTWQEKGPVRAVLTIYFMEAIDAIADRRYSREFALSHACFTVFSKRILALVDAGEPMPPRVHEQGFMVQVIDQCESIARDVAQTLDKKRR